MFVTLSRDSVKKHLDGISGSTPIPISHMLIFLISGPLKLAAASSVLYCTKYKFVQYT